MRRQDGSAFPEELVANAGRRYAEPPDDDATEARRDAMELRLALIGTMRARLATLSRSGLSSSALRHALAELDADELNLRLRLDDSA